MKNLICIIVFCSHYVFGQTTEIVEQIKLDVEFLADDRLEGRETGTKGEKIALEYIKKRFSQMNIPTKTQEFLFNKKAKVVFSCDYDGEIYPTKYSSSGTIKNKKIVDAGFGIDDENSNYSDYSNIDLKNKVALINTSSPDGTHPHSKYIKYQDLTIRVKIAKNKGAAAVVLYSDDKNAETPKKKFKKIYKSEIPVLFVENKEDFIKTNKISFNVHIEEQKNTGQNLIAELNNNKKHTIIIGAHYDHIGWGEEGSLYRGEPAIHNGADDNASGVAGMLELARYYKNSKHNNYNYVFVAFSGEEKGLLGSSAYAKSKLLDKKSINYMINMDMIGRMDSLKNIAVFGTGTSNRWPSLLDENMLPNTIVSKNKSGIGASDHTSFYLQDLPVLHFFTGAHEDYHRPTDDAEKINFKGIETVTTYIKEIINDLDDEPKISFVKTITENSATPRFSVTLGVVPDYLFSGKGMRIDAVSDNRPAQKSGIIKGDIVVALGGYSIIDMMSYMRALSKFNKGDVVLVEVLRKEKRLTKEVTF